MSVFAAGRDLAVAEGRLARHVGHEREHRLEIIGEARRGQRHLVAPGDDRQRGAAAVEVVGNHVRRALERAAIEHPRAERCGAVALPADR